MGISSVGSFPVQSGGSLTFFQLFRFRNLALNRFFQIFLVAGMCFKLGGHLDAPYIHIPYTFVCPLGCRHHHMSPILLYASVYSEKHLHVVGIVRGSLHVGHLLYMQDTSIWGMPPHVLYPHPLVGFPVHLYV